MKYFLILFLLLFSCGKEIVYIDAPPVGPPPEEKDFYVKVEYRVYLVDPGPLCTGYDVTATYKDENEQIQEKTIRLYYGGWSFVFYHFIDISQIFEVEVDRQGNMDRCGPLRVDLFVGDILKDSQTGTVANQILEVYYEYSEEFL